MRRQCEVKGICLLTFLASLLTPSSLGGGYPTPRKAERVIGTEIVLKNAQMEVVLDSQFPRVIEYRVPSRPVLPAAIMANRPTVELNGTLYTPAEFTVTSQAAPKEASYRMAFPRLRLTLEFAFQLEESKLLVKLTRVDESGSFRLTSLYFPDHFLIRMPALTPGASMYRG